MTGTRRLARHWKLSSVDSAASSRVFRSLVGLGPPGSVVTRLVPRDGASLQQSSAPTSQLCFGADVDVMARVATEGFLGTADRRRWTFFSPSPAVAWSYSRPQCASRGAVTPLAEWWSSHVDGAPDMWQVLVGESVMVAQLSGVLAVNWPPIVLGDGPLRTAFTDLPSMSADGVVHFGPDSASGADVCAYFLDGEMTYAVNCGSPRLPQLFASEFLLISTPGSLAR